MLLPRSTAESSVAALEPTTARNPTLSPSRSGMSITSLFHSCWVTEHHPPAERCSQLTPGISHSRPLISVSMHAGSTSSLLILLKPDTSTPGHSVIPSSNRMCTKPVLENPSRRGSSSPSVNASPSATHLVSCCYTSRRPSPWIWSTSTTTSTSSSFEWPSLITAFAYQW